MPEPSAAEGKCAALIVDQGAPTGQVKTGTNGPSGASATRFLDAASMQKKSMTVQTQMSRPANHADIYCWLKQMVTEFHFGQGAPILVNDVADRLRVSATPVRETLIRLRSEGFLDDSSRRGFLSKALTTREMVDLHNLLSLLLTHSLGYLRGTQADAADLSREQGDDDPRAHVRRLDSIWESLISLTGNEEMIQIVRNTCERTRYVRTIDLEIPEHLALGRRFIDELLAAMRLRDAEGAARLIRHYFDDKIERMSTLVKEGISRSYVAETSCE
jgi:DNA-binding GntR family transcriptional regulator